MNEAATEALLVGRKALSEAQLARDVLGANAIVMDTCSTDVRSLLGDLRAEHGLDRGPLTAYAHPGRMAAERIDGTPAGWAPERRLTRQRKSQDHTTILEVA